MYKKLANSEKWPNNCFAKNLVYACCYNCKKQGVIHGNIKYVRAITDKFYCIDCLDKLPFEYDIETATSAYLGHLDDSLGLTK